MTPYGGITGSGTVFSFDPQTNTQLNLYSFNASNTNSTSPSGGLFKASNGQLYGISDKGGVTDQGTIFSYDPHSMVRLKASLRPCRK